MVSGCAIVDAFILSYNIRNKVDVFAPWFYVAPLLILNIYTIFFVVLIDKRELMDSHLFLSILILMPCFIYLLIHTFLVLLWIMNLLKMVFPD
jgi:hypothetical protein